MRFVTRAKKDMSVFSIGHGRVPARPMPRGGDVAQATIMVMGVEGPRIVKPDGGWAFEAGGLLDFSSGTFDVDVGSMDFLDIL